MNTIISKNDHYKQVLEKALAYLGVDGVTVTISVNARLLGRLSNENIELTAATFPTALENTYNLCIRRANVSDVTLCHEAVHIKQYADKRLSMTAEGHIIWEGEEFTKDSDYFQRPWEEEAFGKYDNGSRQYGNLPYKQIKGALATLLVGDTRISAQNAYVNIEYGSR